MQKGISALDEQTVHTLSTNQVVVSLQVAVKELVENALDAGATRITVRLVENGLELIEVRDNGSGIDGENFDRIAMRHATSKIQAFDDLEKLNTFGFRGEALAALAAISTLKMTTKCQTDKIGTEIEFDQFGGVKSKTVKVQSTVGSAVQIVKLFHRIPVRRSVLIQNSKRELQKTLVTLMGYALTSDTRLVVQLQTGKVTKTSIQTKLNESLKSKISSVLGAEIALKLTEIDDKLEPSKTDIESFFNLAESASDSKYDEIRQKVDIFSFSGFVSRNDELGGGRTAPDRQFIFVNSRPVDVPFLTKVLNAEWRKCSSKRYPVIVLNINVDQSAVDVNLAPDKRTVLLQNQKHCQFRFK